MARRPLSDNAVAASRERIAAVATRLFAQHGFQGVTMRAVAEELSLSAMALYRYVADKDELLALVRTHACRRFADGQARAYDAGDDPRSRILLLGQAYLTFALSEADAYRIMFELSQPSGDHPELTREVERSFSYLRRAFEDASKAKLFSGDALTTAHFAWALVHGIVSLHLADKLNMGRDVQSLMVQLGQALDFLLSPPQPPRTRSKR